MHDGQQRIPITNDFDVACAVMISRQLAKDLGFRETAQCKISTTVSELGHNIIKYAGCGWIVLLPLTTRGQTGLEIRAEDNGPGIDDVACALQDNYSTGGTLGLGLPGVRRLMDEFVVQSEPQTGTKVTARKWL
ncbi:MAG: ATP-binding protein [Gemmataceae bacterium]